MFRAEKSAKEEKPAPATKVDQSVPKRRRGRKGAGEVLEKMAADAEPLAATATSGNGEARSRRRRGRGAAAEASAATANSSSGPAKTQPSSSAKWVPKEGA